MLIKMADGHRLLIFENFEVDHTLPKHQADKAAEADVELAGGIVPVEDELGDSGSPVSYGGFGPRQVRMARESRRAARSVLRREWQRRQDLELAEWDPEREQEDMDDMPLTPARWGRQKAKRVPPKLYRRLLDAMGIMLFGEKAWAHWTADGVDWSLVFSEYGASEPTAEEDESPETPLGILEYFAAIKEGVELLAPETVVARAEGFELALLQARVTGQQALQEQLLARIETVRGETQLLQAGVTKFVTEKTLVELTRRCKRGLRLDWITNFTRVIPPEVVAAKKRCDDLLVFDAWVVLHYDPSGTAVAKTKAQRKAEVERRKDPILFGLLEGSRRLYYVADWVDELCDLTLDKVAELLGRDPSLTLSPDDFLGEEPRPEAQA